MLGLSLNFSKFTIHSNILASSWIITRFGWSIKCVTEVSRPTQRDRVTGKPRARRNNAYTVNDDLNNVV